MYLNGKGINKKTSELDAAVWAAIPMAFVGLCAAFIGPLFSYAFLIGGESWNLRSGIGVSIAVICGVGGGSLAWPWFRAIRAISKHTNAMRTETKARGRGWASN